MLEERRLHQVLVVVIVDVGRAAAQMADGQLGPLARIGVEGLGDQAVIGFGAERVDEVDAARHGVPHQRRCCSLLALRPGRS